MTRVVDWPEQLLETVDAWRERPFMWGSDDCLGFVLACVKAVRGELPVAEIPAYADAKEARRVLRELGARELENVLMMHFEPVPVSMAQRGDIGIVKMPHGFQAAVVCVGRGWLGKSESGLVAVDRRQVERAFRI